MKVMKRVEDLWEGNYLMEKELQLGVKRGIDVLVSSILLILFSPLFAIISLLIVLTSKGPVFYPWKVVGKDGKPFVGYKFRTMYADSDITKENLLDKNEMTGPAFSVKNDPRVTAIGKFLRIFSIDEFPQLFSVLKGDMSLVGPRPPLQDEYQDFEDWQKRKVSVKPGMCCLREVKQVEKGKKIKDFDEWVKLDLEYIDNWSLWLDFRILVKTAIYILTGKNY